MCFETCRWIEVLGFIGFRLDFWLYFFGGSFILKIEILMLLGDGIREGN